jgi:hypothetical protein
VKSHDLGMELLPIHKLFDSLSHFYIPEYQRNYSWGEEEVTEFLDDLSNALSKSEPGDDRDIYLLGQILLCPNDSRPQGLDSDVESLEVIDGQQRLTTIYLLLAILLQRISPDWTLNLKAGRADKWKKWQALLLLGNNDEEDRPILRVTSSYVADEFWKAVIAGEALPDAETVSEVNLEFAAKTIGEFITRLETDEDRFEILSYLMQQVSVISLRLPDSKQALQMFMNLNNRGMKLDPSDIIKAHFFKHAARADYGHLSEKWGKAQDALLGQKQVKLITSMQNLMRMLLGVKTGKYISNDELFNEWTEYLGNAGEREIAEKVRLETEELPNRAESLVKISKRQAPRGGDTLSELRGIRVVNAHSMFEVLLGGAHLEPESFLELGRIVEARTVLQAFSKVGFNLLEPKIHPWAHKISQLDPLATREDILRVSRVALKESDLEPLLKELVLKVGNLSYLTRSEHLRIRYLLARINSFVQKKFNVTHHSIDNLLVTRAPSNSNGYDLDHIFPKSAERREFWSASPAMDKKLGDTDRSREVINAIGNLSLLRGTDNEFSGSDLPWSDEKSKAYSVSELIICRLLSPSGFADISTHPPHQKALESIGWPSGLTLDKWNEDATMTLQEFYAKTFVRLLSNDLGIGHQ